MSWLEIALDILISIFQGYTLYRYCNIFMRKHKECWRIIIGWSIYYVIQMFLMYLLMGGEFSILLVAVSFLVNFFVHYIVYECGVIKKILFTVLYYVIGMCAEVVTCLPVMVSGVIYQDYKYECAIFTNITLFCIVYLLEKFYPSKYIMDIRPINHFIILLIPSGSMIIIHSMFHFEMSEVGTILITLIILLFNILLFTIYARMLEGAELQQFNRQYKEQLNTCQQHMEEKAFLMSEYRRIAHDVKHQQTFLQTLLEMDTIEALKESIEELVQQNTVESIDVIHTGNVVVDSLLNQKCAIAYTKDILVEYKIRMPDEFSFLESDLSILLGNALDNAIEACEKVEPSKRKIILEIQYDRGNLLIDLSNSYEEEARRTVGSRLKTTKADEANHGIGMSSIEKIVNQYEGNMEFAYVKQMFRLSILLYEPVLEHNYSI